ncbi:ubiquinol-cytochrome C chaperone family protein [Sphingomonas sp. HF-S4]|uniref:Ubiquinol-cytochrome C chaperone family protein n=1 Tax=Sphingomonas agrestis TaxID=3080540 RepID=A0ABU3YAF5_9SPHN|nr:ubiquinol-cytochrome C chaperone family protein [Sphingomonas sp. HF-S4]MDV3458379.1 ubiquinol-cytochrome C chaperone family protein [Sphingomonas sp. HF-S4]
MGLLKRLFGAPDRGTAPQLYAAIVATGRAPHWYAQGDVPDTIDGRFDMIAAVLAFMLLRLEGEPEANAPSTALAECFIDDMDGQLRELGVGDIVVGKHMGKMMGMIGGRLGAYREGLAGDGLRDALVRNLYRGNAPSDAGLAHVETELRALRDRLAATPTPTILAGELPQ